MNTFFIIMGLFVWYTHAMEERETISQEETNKPMTVRYAKNGIIIMKTVRPLTVPHNESLVHLTCNQNELVFITMQPQNRLSGYIWPKREYVITECFSQAGPEPFTLDRDTDNRVINITSKKGCLIEGYKINTPAHSSLVIHTLQKNSIYIATQRALIKIKAQKVCIENEPQAISHGEKSILKSHITQTPEIILEAEKSEIHINCTHE